MNLFLGEMEASWNQAPNQQRVMEGAKGFRCGSLLPPSRCQVFRSLRSEILSVMGRTLNLKT